MVTIVTVSLLQVNDLIPVEKERDELFDALRKYQT